MKIIVKKELLKPLMLIGDIVEEVGLVFSEEGLIVNQMDSSKAILCCFTLPKELFEEYENFDMFFKVKASEISPMIKEKKGKGEETIELVLEENKGLYFHVGGRKYLVQMLDMREKQNIPTLTYHTEITVKTEELLGVVTDAYLNENVTTSMNFKVDKERLGIEYKEQTKEFSIESIAVEEIAFGEETQCMYDYKFIASVLDQKISDKVVLKFQKDYPMTLQYLGLPYKLKFILAPRVENN